MSTTFVRPGHLHTASRVLSASTEAGLTNGQPVPAAANKGHLRPRTSGAPLDATVINVLHRTGGNPVGYSTSDVGYGAGAAVVHKESTDTASQYRGYIDTPYLVRVEFPVPYDANGHGYPSTPRQLPNGDLGFLISRGAVFGSLTYFHRVDEAGTVTRTAITTSTATGSCRPELIVMPSGRLLAFVTYNALSINRILTFFSDDNGAVWGQLAEFAYVALDSAHTRICLEYVDDMITGIIASVNGDDGDVIVSRDGGCSFTMTERVAGIGDAPSVCVTLTGKLLLSGCNVGVAGVGKAWPIFPGGGIGAPVEVTESCYHEQPIMCRDDGTVWLWRFGLTSTIGLDAGISVSLDGGLTWSDPTDASLSTNVLNAEFTTLARVYEGISVGMWNGRAIMLAQQNSAQGGTSGQIHMLTWGGWESVTEVRRGAEGQTYDHTYLPAELPDDIGWTRSDTAGGATVTNQPWLRIVTTASTNSLYTSQAGFYGNAIAGTHRARFRTRIVSGGSRTTDVAAVAFFMSDTVNEQSVRFRFASTGVTVTDGAGNQLAAVTADLTGWCDWLLAQQHDAAAGVGRCAIYYRLQGAALWVEAATNVSIAEVVGTREQIEIGGDKLTATTWDLAFIEAADDDNGIAFSFVNPTQLAGRPLSASADWYLTNGIRMGGRNGGAVPGDTYIITPTYNYPKEAIWRELRPSKKVHSAADNTAWNVVFDAGANSQFKGDIVGLFGTNFRTATLEFNTTDSWAPPAATVALDAAVATFAVGTSIRGPGFVGPDVSPNWRPGQYRSDGDGHRWFMATAAGTVYEITDNDSDRLYIDGIDFSLLAGDAVIFGDRMGATTTRKAYRFMRLSVGAQQTPAVDDCYHVGTLVFDMGFTPAQLYDFGFVDRVEPRVTLTETDGGYRASSRVGPRQHTLAIQWAPIAYQSSSTDLEARIRDFYASLEGGVFMFWRDTSDQCSLGLYRFNGMYQASNVRGEGTTALTRIDQLLVTEEP